MGWLISYDKSKKQIIADRTRTQVSEDGRVRWVFPKYCVRGNCLWKICVIEMQDEHGEWVEDKRFIALDLLAKGTDGMGWGYKDMSEFSGPVEISCPVSYLDATPEPDPEEEYAVNWRKRVRERAEKRQAITILLRSLKPGDILWLKKGCRPEMVKLKSTRPLRGYYNYMMYRISRRYIDVDRTREANSLPSGEGN